MSFKDFAILSVAEAFAKTGSEQNGLSGSEAVARLGRFGKNEFRSAAITWWEIFLRQFKSPFLYLLLAAAILAIALGEKIDGLMILGFVVINVGIGFYQEYQSEQSVALLKKMVTSKVLVRRNGKESLVDSREIVPGDLVIVKTGDRLQADLRWIEVDNLTVDESVLTGESVAVEKTYQALSKEVNDFFGAKNVGFSGTIVARGRGVGLVISTGSEAEFAKIAKLAVESEAFGAFEKGISQLSSFILRLILITLVVVFLANILIKRGEASIPELLIFSIALAVSVIPEALPLVTTMTLSRGALRLAKKKVVAKKLSAIEDLGSVDILCTDKTGTMTENLMKVAAFFSDNKDYCLRLAALAAPPIDPKTSVLRANFDGAVLEYLSEELRGQIRSVKRENEVPFDPVRRWNSVVVEDDGRKILIVRGAPEELIKLSIANSFNVEKVNQWVTKQGNLGNRVLAVAWREVGGATVVAEDGGLSFAGVLAFNDPIKPTAKQAVAEAKRLGVNVKVLTGDSLEVSGAVAKKIGLIKSSDEVIAGETWAKLAPNERIAAAKKYSVFARVTPEHKFLIIKTLQEKFEVGFLGDGINDAPALKVASVGLAVDDASDIARESADLVLLDHDLGVIISGIREGREIFANTTKYIKITLTSNFGNFIAVAIATLLIDFLPMLPIQLLLLNLLSDFPMISIAADTVDNEELKRPRHYQVKEIAVSALVLGVVSTVFDLLCFWIFSHISPETLWTNWFIASVLTELILILSLRTKKPFFLAKAPATVLTWLSISAAAAAVIIPFIALGRELFRFIRPAPESLLTVFGLVLIYFVSTEVVKLGYYRFRRE
jgi:Mg2+-importing ATPase